MTNLSKNGNRQTALDLGDQFDEAAYRAELIAAGIEPASAADVAAKTAQARGKRDRSPLNVGASLNLPPAIKEAVQRVDRAQEKATPAKKGSSQKTEKIVR